MHLGRLAFFVVVVFTTIRYDKQMKLLCRHSHIAHVHALFRFLFFSFLLQNPANVFDFVVVVVSIVLAGLNSKTAGAGVGVLRGLRAAYRVSLALRVLRTVSTTQRQAQGAASQAARNVTGENKKRFVDLQNNFDIDLTYVFLARTRRGCECMVKGAV